MPEINEDELAGRIAEWQAQYGRLGHTEIGREEFLWRLLTRAEYRVLMEADLSPEEKEEWVCSCCTLYPPGYDFTNCLGGVPTTLAREILKESGFSYDGNPNPLGREMLERFREEMSYFENQVDCIIIEAFPYLRLEEVAAWTVEKTMYYYSRAEWVLSQLRGIQLVDVATGRPVSEFYRQVPKRRGVRGVAETRQPVPT
ncbi:MAG: hypothetical protein AB1330_01255 [Bacillota bacterium]